MGFRGTLGFRDASQGFREAFQNLKKEIIKEKKSYQKRISGILYYFKCFKNV